MSKSRDLSKPQGGDMRAEIPNPSMRNGELVGLFRVWEKGADGEEDKIIFRKDTVRFQMSEEQQELVQHLVELNYPGAEGEVAKLIRDALARAQGAGDEKSNPFEHPKHGPWARRLIQSMTPKSRWINSPDGEYWMNGTNDRPVLIKSMEMHTILWEKEGINESDDFAKYAINAMRYHARLTGEKVKLHEFAVYQHQENRMLVDMGDGNVAVLDGGEVSFERNGAHGVLFKPVKFQVPWTYVKDHGSPLQELIESVNFADHESSALSVTDQRWLLLLYICSIFFGSMMPAKPIAIATGDTGAGKSTMFKIIGKILVGGEWSLKRSDEEKQSDFYVAVTENFMSGWDNVDRGSKWLEDALCTASDGVPVSKRKLHTTNEEGLYKPECFIQITSRTPEFRRKDVATRGIVFHLAARGEGSNPGEKSLYDKLEGMRDRYMSELVDLINASLREKWQAANDSPIRNSDFWSVCRRIAQARKLDQEKVRSMFRRVKQTQDGFATEENAIVLAALDWLERTRAGGALNSGFTITSKQLFLELKAIADKNGYPWAIENDRAFGRALNELAANDGLASYFKFEDHGRAPRVGRQVTLTSWEDVKKRVG